MIEVRFPRLAILKLQQTGAVNRYYPDLSGKGSLEPAFRFLFLPEAHSNQSRRLTVHTVALLLGVAFDSILFFGALCLHALPGGCGQSVQAELSRQLCDTVGS